MRFLGVPLLAALLLAAAASAQAPGGAAQPAAGAAPDPARGQALVHRGSDTVFACRNCHGLDGRGDPFGTFPRLSGQHAGYLTKQLEDFRADRRPGTQMSNVASGLADRDIADITAWFASSGAPGFTRRPDPSLLDRGKRIATEGDADRGLPACTSCHGDTLSGSPDPDFLVPSLAGQAPGYLDRMLRWWAAEKRANDPGGVMRMIAAMLTEDERAALVAYLSTLAPRETGAPPLPPLAQR